MAKECLQLVLPRKDSPQLNLRFAVLLRLAVSYERPCAQISFSRDRWLYLCLFMDRCLDRSHLSLSLSLSEGICDRSLFPSVQDRCQFSLSLCTRALPELSLSLCARSLPELSFPLRPIQTVSKHGA